MAGREQTLQHVTPSESKEAALKGRMLQMQELVFIVQHYRT